MNRSDINHRRRFIKQAGAAGISIVTLSQLLSACKAKVKINPLNAPQDAPFRIEYLKGNVGYFEEKGGTIMWMVNEGGIVVVDTQFPASAKHLIDQLKLIRDRKIDVVINTHHHGDHTGGNVAFKDLTEVIIAHENSRSNQERSAKEKGKESEILLPNRTFKSNYSYTIGDETIGMKYFGAAHTDGDIIVHFEKNNVVHMGDLVFNRRFPYIDTGAGANIANWVSVLDTVVNSYPDDASFVWGHAGLGHRVFGTKEDIKAFMNYLERLLEFGGRCIKDGKTAAEVIANTKVIPGAVEWKGKGIERSINAVYHELSKS